MELRSLRVCHYWIVGTSLLLTVSYVGMRLQTGEVSRGFYAAAGPASASPQRIPTISSDSSRVDVTQSDQVSESKDCQCSSRGDNEIPMTYKPPSRSGITTRGRPLNVSQSVARRLGMPPVEFKTLTQKSVKDFVFVTACSSNHFLESQDAIASVQEHYPDRRILYYDIGLTEDQRQEVRTWCSVTLRDFDDDKYPPHIRERSGKHFKPLVVMDALFQYGGVVWMDASIRFRPGEMEKAYKKLLKSGGFYTFLPLSFWAYIFLHPNTYARLATDIERQKTNRVFVSSVFTMHLTEDIYWNIAHWWFLCALDPECVPPHPRLTQEKYDCSDIGLYNAPEGATGRSSCHSFDQASLNILASNYYGFNRGEYNPLQKSVDMERRPTDMYGLQVC